MRVVKIRPPQNWNPSTDYDKTLHNWLSPWGKLVTQIWHKSVVRECLANYVKYKACHFYFYFFNDSPTEVTRLPILTHNGSNYAESRKDVPFLGPLDGRRRLGGQISQKTL